MRPSFRSDCVQNVITLTTHEIRIIQSCLLRRKNIERTKWARVSHQLNRMKNKTVKSRCHVYTRSTTIVIIIEHTDTRIRFLRAYHDVSLRSVQDEIQTNAIHYYTDGNRGRRGDLARDLSGSTTVQELAGTFADQIHFRCTSECVGGL